MGDAHRAASHDFKEEAGVEDDGIDGGEDCDDGLDI